MVQMVNQENKPDSYAELVRLLDSDISTATSNGTITIEYCPDNTCESFSMQTINPDERLSDFVFLYLYFVSDYYYLDNFRKKVEPEQVTKIIVRNSQDKNKKQLESSKHIMEALVDKYSIKAKFVRYDEHKRNEVDMNLKSHLEKLK